MQKIMRAFWAAVLALSAYRPAAFCEERASADLAPILIIKKNPVFTHSYSVDPEVAKAMPFSSPIESLEILPVDAQSRSPRAGIQTDFSLRGATFQGVSVLLNGQRINDPQTGHHNSDIPLTKEDIETIRVLPGACSSLYGPDAIGGAIQIIPKRPQRRALIVELSGGQYRTESALLSFTERRDAVGARFSFENETSAGFREDTGFKKLTAAGSALLELPNGEAYGTVGYQKKDFGAYDFYTPNSGFLSKEWTRTIVGNWGCDVNMAGVRFKPDLLWRRHFDTFMLDKTGERSAYLSRHRTDVYTPAMYCEKETPLLGIVGLGMVYGGDDIHSSSMGKHRREYRSFYVKESKEVTTRTSAGFSLRRDDVGSLHHMYTAAAGLKNKLSPEHAIHCGISRSIRVPSFTELYYADPTTRGNEDVSAEKAVACEAGYDYTRTWLSTGVTLFSRRESDGIDWVKKDLLQEKWRAENISRADVFGMETHIGLRSSPFGKAAGFNQRPAPSAQTASEQCLHTGLTTDFYYTYLDKLIQDGGYVYKYGPNYTRHLANALASLSLPWGIQTVAFTYKKKPCRDGWLLVDIFMSRYVKKNFTLFVKATNVFNIEYQEIEGIPQPGRWLMAGFRGEW